MYFQTGVSFMEIPSISNKTVWFVKIEYFLVFTSQMQKYGIFQLPSIIIGKSGFYLMINTQIGCIFFFRIPALSFNGKIKL